eukprot:s19_g31.t1
MASVEWRPPLADLHRSCHPGVPVLVSDVASPSCAKDILQCVEPPFTVMSGFSCQPYSSGGSQGGSDDERANTLPGTIRICHLCQAPVVVLECVTPARCNKYVKAHLQVLEQVLGYRVCRQTLRLEDVWMSRRYRWWVVALHSFLGSVSIPNWPKSPHLTVRDLFPVFKHWAPEVLQQLLLAPHEVETFTLDGSHLRKYLLQLYGPMPTCLHSWGSQADPCPCGCRHAFSEALVRSRGIYGQIIQVPGESGQVRYRHIHPCELALPSGWIPPAEWYAPDFPSLRLGLCAAEIDLTQQDLDGSWCDSGTGERLALDTQVAGRNIRVCPFASGATGVRPDLPDLGLPASVLAAVPLDFSDAVPARVASETSVASEVPVTVRSGPSGEVPESVGSAGGSASSSSTLPLVPAGPSVPDSLLGLKHLTGLQLAALLPPLVQDVRSCRHMREAIVPAESRLEILAQQEP